MQLSHKNTLSWPYMCKKTSSTSAEFPLLYCTDEKVFFRVNLERWWQLGSSSGPLQGKGKGFTHPLSLARFSQRCPGIHFSDLPIKILLLWHWGIAPPFHSSVRLKCTKHTLPILKHWCLYPHCNDATFIYVPPTQRERTGLQETPGEK